MKSTHDGYTHLADLCEDLAADTRIPAALAGRIGALHTAMDGSSISLGIGDMGLVMQALSYVSTNGIKTTHV